MLLACRQGSSSAPLPKSTTLSVDDDDDGKGSFRFNQRLSKAPALPASYIDRLVWEILWQQLSFLPSFVSQAFFFDSNHIAPRFPSDLMISLLQLHDWRVGLDWHVRADWWMMISASISSEKKNNVLTDVLFSFPWSLSSVWYVWQCSTAGEEEAYSYLIAFPGGPSFFLISNVHHLGRLSPTGMFSNVWHLLTADAHCWACRSSSYYLHSEYFDFSPS